jgi:hypothetical protein
MRIKALKRPARFPRAEELAPLISRCTNRLFGVADPEVWFRIVHITLEDTAGSVACREQTVEIALGPHGAFENGNIGTLTRRVPNSQVVCAIPPPRSKPKPPKLPKTSQVVEFLRKALKWQALLESGEAKSQGDIAQREGISRLRVNQIMCLVRLAPEIQEQLLRVTDQKTIRLVSEARLRLLTQIADPARQLEEFRKLLAQLPSFTQ